MMCFTEQQKQEIVHTGMLVVEFKQLLIRSSRLLKEVFVSLKDILLQIADRIAQCVQMISKEYRDVPPKKRYKVVHRLNKCGFTEKEINLMVCGAYRCRNNC